MKGAAGAVAATLLLLGIAACAHRPKAAPVTPGEDYVFPGPVGGAVAATPAEEGALRRVWEDVLVGDSVSAERRVAKLSRRLLRERTRLDTLSAYARLRAGRAAEALSGFERVLERVPDYLPALVGGGSAALRAADADRALALYRRAQLAAPSDALVRKRIASLKLQVAERHIARARSAADSGDVEGAVAEYQAALGTAPEIAALRVPLAELLLRKGDSDGAVAVLAADPTGDRPVRLRLGSLLLDRGEYARAEDAYAAVLARDPADAAARAGLAAVRDAFEAAAMPEEYRRIPAAERLTRADLAALLVVRIKALRRAGAGEPKVAVDISGSWAREQIASALALDVLDVYPNHTFQPGAVVRRVDLARAVARVLDVARWPRAAAPPPADMTRSHLDFEAVERVLGAGLMSLLPDGAFEPWRPVSGREALDVVDSAARLVGS